MFWRHEKNQSHSAISQVTQWNLNACGTSVFCGLSLCSSKIWMISNVDSAGLTCHMHASSVRPPLHSLHPLCVPKLFILSHFAATGLRQNHNTHHNQPGYALFSRAVAALQNICWKLLGAKPTMAQTQQTELRLKSVGVVWETNGETHICSSMEIRKNNVGLSVCGSRGVHMCVAAGSGQLTGFAECDLLDVPGFSWTSHSCSQCVCVGGRKWEQERERTQEGKRERETCRAASVSAQQRQH